MQSIRESLVEVVGPYLPRLAAAVVVLVVGWLVALVIAAVVRALLKRTTIDDRIAKWIAGEEKVEAIDLEAWIARCVYYLAMLFVLIGFFQTLGLTVITEPLNRLLTQIFEFAPRVLGALALTVAAWLVATVVRLVVRRLLDATRIDDKLSAEAGLADEEKVPLSDTLADALYWLVFLLFLPAILGALALEGILQPVQAMLDKFLSFLPNLIAAAVTLFVGWFLARIVRRIVTNLLAAAGLDRLGERVGLSAVLGEQRLSGLVGLIAYVLILIPILIASLNALGLESLTAPASNMLNALLAAVPQLFGAALLLTIAYVVARLVAGLVTNLLAGVGFDGVLGRLGLGGEPKESGRKPSELVGMLVLAAVMTFAAIEASDMLGFARLSGILTDLLELAGRIALGLVVFGLGLFLANFAAGAVKSAGGAHANLLAGLARVAILLLTGAMALRQMGLANEIISLAFGLTLGAVAVAAAIAFGVGGRDLARKQLERWAKALEKE